MMISGGREKFTRANGDKEKLAEISNRDDDYSKDEQSFIFDAKTGEIFGRTLNSWGRILLFSLIFNATLAAFWGSCLGIFYQTLDNYEPKLQLDSSHIGQNPGLGYRPLSAQSDPYSSLIWFRHGGAGNWDDLVEELDRYLVEYEPGYWANAGTSQTKCSWNRGPLNEEEACEFNKEWLSDQGSDVKCINEEYYGYYHGKPCLLLKLNRIYGWNPEPYYNLTEVESLSDMPSSLKAHIRQVWEENCKGHGSEIENRCPRMNMVWLHCDGEDDPDKESIGTITYTPWRGFPAYFFPYWNQRGYLQPVVMVQLKNPTPAVLINIECTAWAKGIEHDRTKKRGSVHLEFIMD